MIIYSFFIRYGLTLSIDNNINLLTWLLCMLNYSLLSDKNLVNIYIIFFDYHSCFSLLFFLCLLGSVLALNVRYWWTLQLSKFYYFFFPIIYNCSISKYNKLANHLIFISFLYSFT